MAHPLNEPFWKTLLRDIWKQVVILVGLLVLALGGAWFFLSVGMPVLAAACVVAIALLALAYWIFWT